METEHRNASFSGTFILTIFAIVLVAGLAAAWLRLNGVTESYDDARAKLRALKLQQLHSADHKEMTSYGWANKEKGLVRIPIEKAMQLVGAELKSKPVQPSAVQVENPYPAGLMSPAAPVSEVKK